MTGSIHVNSIGKAHLDALVAGGKASDAPWSAPSKGEPAWYLAVDSSEPASTEAHYKYPFTSDGKTANKKALASIESYATTNNQPDVASAAHEALAKLDAKKMSEGAQTTLSNVEVLKVGSWNASTGKVQVTPAMLSEIVDNFGTVNQVAGYGVPLKLGHNDRVGEPAYGWMSALRSDGNTLTADFQDVDAAIVDAIGKRRYTSVSVELYPSVTYAEKKFANVLGGVALLGAEWPAVKGLKPLSVFAEQGVTLNFSTETEIMNFTQEQHDAILASAVAKAKEEAVAAVKAANEALANELKLANERATRAEGAVKALSDDSEKATIAAIIKAAEDKGQIVPATKAKYEALAETLRGAVADATARKAALATFKEIVDALPAKVSFKEHGASAQAKPGSETAKAADAVDAAAKALMAKDNKLNYSAAVDAVFATDPDLKARYAAGE